MIKTPSSDISAAHNWLHLDLKGIIPGKQKLLAWIDFFAETGFNGIVWEIEDRIPWQTWPDTFRPGYSIDDWRDIIEHCHKRRLETIPLIQTQGHLEWLLKHDRWASWRENGCYNELCPQVSDVMPAIEAWLDEVLALHPNTAYLHIGGDETWNLATCPRCQAVAADHPEGKMGVFIDHVSRVAQAVIDRGVQPMMWADMFWRENRIDLAALLPDQTVLVDWQYIDAGPWATVAKLAESGRPVWGASAVRCGFDGTQALAPLEPRVQNVLGWQAQRGVSPVAGMIHTTWGRGRSLMPLYGPWEGWLPAFIAAGAPTHWMSEPLASWTARLDEVMSTIRTDWVTSMIDALSDMTFDGIWREQCRRWWLLALRHRLAYLSALRNGVDYDNLKAVHQSVGIDPDVLNHRRLARAELLDELDAWSKDVTAYFAENALDGAAEFTASRTLALRRMVRDDWAAEAIPFHQPMSDK